MADEEVEQLYMLEVVLDSVRVLEDRAVSGKDPILPAMARIKFGDFPVLEIERNPSLIFEAGSPVLPKDALEAGDARRRGMPPEWEVKEGLEDLDIQIPYMDQATSVRETLSVRVPRSVVAAGEGLRFVLSTAKEKLGPAAWQAIQERVSQQLGKDRESGPRTTQHSFSAGKSCLFHLAPSELVGNMAEHSISVRVYRNSSEGNEFVNTLIGETKVQLDMSFTKAVLLSCTPGAMYPITAHISSFFPMYDGFDCDTGDMHLFVRLSCFGPTPFQSEEDEELRKQKILKNLLKKEKLQYPREKPDVKYPWLKNLDAVPDRPAPKPSLQPVFQDDTPAPPLPPFEFGEYFPDMPRCSPFTPTPCYRKSGDEPLSSCPKRMEEQLMRESLTKGIQTGVPAPSQPGEDNVPTRQSAPAEVDVPSQSNEGVCTCPKIPTDLVPGEEQKPKFQCACAAILKTIVAPQEVVAKMVSAPAAQPPPAATRKAPVSKPPQPLGDSDYEITLTKAECGLENKIPEVEEKKQTGHKEQVESKPVLSNPQIETVPEEKVEKKVEKVPSEKKNKTGGVHVLAKEAAAHKSKKAKSKPPVSEQINIETEGHQPDETDFNIDDYEPEPKRRKMRSPYEQTAGMYPGHHFGHRRCITRQKPVPKNMGWLWTAVNFGPKNRGWYPGSIRQDVNNMLTRVKEDSNAKGPQSAVEKQSAPGKVGKYQRSTKRQPQSSKPAEVLKYNPNLHVHKKENYYYVSLLPVKTRSQEEAGKEPAPIEYKIDPRHPNGSDTDSQYSYSSSSNVKSYEMNFIVPLALQKRKEPVEKATLGVQYNEQDFFKKLPKKPALKQEPDHKEDAKGKDKGKKEPAPKEDEKKGKDKGKKGAKKGKK